MSFEIDRDMFKSTLKSTSIDEEHGNTPLLQQEDPVYNFDGVKKCICRKLRGANECSSCDALYVVNNNYYLLEFKNQTQQKVDRANIQKKAFDSFNLLRITFDKRCSFDELMEKTTLLVIYKEEEKPGLEGIRNKFGCFAKLEDHPIAFGLSEIQGKLYNKIYTVSDSYFLNHLYSSIFDSEVS